MNKKGIASTTVIYSFFVVFLLVLIASVMTFSNKSFLQSKINPVVPRTEDYQVCTKSDTFGDCLFKQEYSKYSKSSSISTSYLSDSTLNDVDKTKESIGNRTINSIESGASKYEGMYAKDDNFGKSYFYRGDGNNNYVEFAGFLWRIVRINGDGSIRLILTEDNEAKVDLLTKFDITKETWLTGKDKTVKGILGLKHFDTSNNLADFWGRYDYKYANDENAIITDVLYNFYNTYLETYGNYMQKDQIYCSEKSDVKTTWDTIGHQKEKYCSFYGDLYNKLKQADEWYEGWGDKAKLLAITGSCKTGEVFKSFKLDYYDSYTRFYDTSKLSLKCKNLSELGNDANNTCHSAQNLGIYSNQGKIKYNITQDNLGIWGCGSTEKYCTDSSCNVNNCTKPKKPCDLDYSHCSVSCVGNCDSAKTCRLWGGTWNDNKWWCHKAASGGALEITHQGCNATVKERLKIYDVYDRLKNSYENGDAILAYESGYQDIIGNGQLDSPIGLITMDEVILSGLYDPENGSANSSSLDSSQFKNYWTMSPGLGDYNDGMLSTLSKVLDVITYLDGRIIEYNDMGDTSATYYWTVNNYKVGLTSQYQEDKYYARPVINLKAAVYYVNGDGSKSNPYEITINKS